MQEKTYSASNFSTQLKEALKIEQNNFILNNNIKKVIKKIELKLEKKLDVLGIEQNQDSFIYTEVDQNDDQKLVEPLFFLESFKKSYSFSEIVVDEVKTLSLETASRIRIEFKIINDASSDSVHCYLKETGSDKNAFYLKSMVLFKWLKNSINAFQKKIELYEVYKQFAEQLNLDDKEQIILKEALLDKDSVLFNERIFNLFSIYLFVGVTLIVRKNDFINNFALEAQEEIDSFIANQQMLLDDKGSIKNRTGRHIKGGALERRAENKAKGKEEASLSLEKLANSLSAIFNVTKMTEAYDNLFFYDDELDFNWPTWIGGLKFVNSLRKQNHSGIIHNVKDYLKYYSQRMDENKDFYGDDYSSLTSQVNNISQAIISLLTFVNNCSLEQKKITIVFVCEEKTKSDNVDLKLVSILEDLCVKNQEYINDNYNDQIDKVIKLLAGYFNNIYELKTVTEKMPKLKTILMSLESALKDNIKLLLTKDFDLNNLSNDLEYFYSFMTSKLDKKIKEHGTVEFEYQKIKNKLKKQSFQTLERHGGKKLTPVNNIEEFSSMYNLDGSIAGKSLTKKENIELLEKANASCQDICDVYGLKKKSIGLQGSLGMTFASHGQGLSKAQGSYDVKEHSFNITKNGDGSFFHEWLHALDYKGKLKSLLANTTNDSKIPDEFKDSIFSLRKVMLTTSYEDFVEDRQNEIKFYLNLAEEKKQEVQKMKVQLEEQLKTDKIYLSDLELSFKDQSEHLNMLLEADPTNTKLLDQARELRQVKTSLKIKTAYVLSNYKLSLKKLDIIESEVRLYNHLAKVSNLDLKEVIENKAKDNLNQGIASYMQKIKKRHDVSLVDLDLNKDELVSSFLLNSLRVDSLGSKLYFGSMPELFARAGETALALSLEEKDMSNNYLQDMSVLETTTYAVYPQGKERERIKKAFDHFIEMAKKYNYL